MKNEQHPPQGTARAGTFSPQRRPFRQRRGLLALCLLLSPFAHLRAQSVDERYSLYTISSTSGFDDARTLDYATTYKYDNTGYIGVSATLDNPLGGTSNFGIKVVEFDNNGLFQQGVLLFPVPPEVTNIYPLKVITLYGNQGYGITGYFKHFSSTCPRPFVVKLDIAFNITVQKFYNDCGFFTDIDQMPNGDFMFVGSWSDSITKLANRRGAIMRTDTNLNPIYSRNVEYFVPTATSMDYDIVHDMVIVDDEHAYATGAYTAQCNTTNSLTSSRLMISEVNLLTGAFNWTNNCFDDSGINDVGARIIYNEKYIVVAANSQGGFVPSITFLDRTTHTYLASFYLEHDTTTLSVGYLLTHIPFIQNIYFIDYQTVFYSGKDIGVQNNNLSNVHYEVPICGKVDINGNVSNGLVFVTDQHYVTPIPLDITSYFASNGNCNLVDAPLYASFNTLPQNGETNAFVTLTHDRINGYENKTWIFTNDINVCSSKELSLVSFSKLQNNSVNLINMSRTNPAGIGLLLNNYTITEHEENCDQYPD